MKAQMNYSGTIVIQAETGMEVYALKKWCEDNAPVFGVADLLIRYDVPEETAQPEQNDES